MLPRIYLSDTENRKHQINTLKVFNDNVTEISEDSEYKISFTSAGTDFVLYVTLSNNFPRDKAIIRISPIVVHPWVNTDGEVTSAPGLLNFTVHSDLGRVVQAIIREFERNPPPLLSDQAVNNIGSKKTNTTDNLISPSFTSNFSTLSNLPTISHMPIATNFCQPVIFPELNALSLEELQFLNDNMDRQQEFVENIPQIREQNRLIDDMIDSVEEIADSNLSKQEYLEKLRKSIDIRIDEVSKLAQENERLHDIYTSLSLKYAPRNIQEQLKLAAQKAEYDSEKVAETFMNGEIDVETFVSSYTKIRTLSQSRKTKEEKLEQQLDKLERAGY